MAAIAFFQNYGDEIEFRDLEDLQSKFSQLDCSVPKRSQGRKTEHEERWCLRLYLMVLSSKGYVQFPISVKKRERPDFIIRSASGTYGLEHTNAGPQEWHRQSAYAETEPGSLLEALPEAQLRNALRKSGEKLIGEGWHGSEAAAEWGKCIVTAIAEKIVKLEDYVRGDARTCALLVYDNTHVSGLVADELEPRCVGPLLRLGLSYEVENLKQYERKLHSVTIIQGCKLYHDALGSCIRLEFTRTD